MKNKLIAGAALISVLGIGGWLYYGDGPIPGKFRNGADSVFNWTAETIRKNPGIWYRSARGEIAAILEDLANSRFNVTRKRIGWQNHRASAKAKVEAYESFLANAKAAYTEAEAAQSFPVSVNGRAYGRTKLRQAIVKVHKDKGREEKRLQTYDEMVAKADVMLGRLTSKMDDLTELDKDLELGQEMADATKSLVDLTGLSNRGAEISATAAALQVEMKAAFDADLNFASPQGGHDGDAAFDAIMNEGAEVTAGSTPDGSLEYA